MEPKPSKVITAWVYHMNRLMPDSISASSEWQDMVARAVDTDCSHEQERSRVMKKIMWSAVFPLAQPACEKFGLGTEWASMLRERTPESIAAMQSAYVEAYGDAVLDISVSEDAWAQIKPVELLERLINVGDSK